MHVFIWSQSLNSNAFYIFLICRCLDSILHAEHKNVLEEMRLDYNLTQSGEKKRTSVNGSARSERDNEPKGNEFESSIENKGGTGSMEEYREDMIEPDMLAASTFSLNLRYLLGYLPRSIKRNSLKESRLVPFFYHNNFHYKTGIGYE